MMANFKLEQVQDCIYKVSRKESLIYCVSNFFIILCVLLLIIIKSKKFKWPSRSPLA